MNNKELRKELLERMYKAGCRYIARNADGNVHVYKTLPLKKRSYWSTRDPFIRLHFFENLFEDVTFEDKKPLNIAEELGFIDWSTIPKNTKVLVSDRGLFWIKSHFKEYQDDLEKPFVVYQHGATSW